MAMGNGPRVSGVRSTLWFIPVMCVLAGVVLSIGTITIDRLTGFDLIPRWMTGGPDAALGILTTIALSMVSLATLVLTITMVVVQLAMGQFSPRIVQTFLRDKPSQLAIGLFVATFAHAMLSMREVQFGDGGQVPGIAHRCRVCVGVDQHRDAGAVRRSHRAVAARVVVDRAGRRRHPTSAR